MVARPGSSLEPAPREAYPAPKEARAKKQLSKPWEALPREMRHFLALLKVHRFEQKRRQEAHLGHAEVNLNSVCIYR